MSAISSTPTTAPSPSRATTRQPGPFMDTLPNCSYIVWGVNLISYDPTDPGDLSGLGSKPVYHYDTYTRSESYKIPEGTVYLADPAYQFSSYSFTTKSAAAITATNLYSASACVSVSAGPFSGWTGLGMASFSASASYKTQHAMQVTTGGVSAESRAAVTCGSLINQSLPLSDAFCEAVAALPIDAADPAYAAFIGDFGTHVPISILFGGRAWQSYSMSASQYTSLQGQGVQVGVGASVGFGLAVGSAEVYTEHQQEQYEALSACSESSSVRYFGGSQLQSWDSWAQTVPSNPLPVKLDLKDISALLTATNFPDDPDIDAKRAALDQAVQTYALQSGGVVVSSGNSPPTSIQQHGYALTLVERQRFILAAAGSSYLYNGASDVINVVDGRPNVAGYFLERLDGQADGPVLSGQIVRIWYIQAEPLYDIPNVVVYVSQVQGNKVRTCAVENLPSADAGNWQILLAAAPSTSGLPLCLGAPLLLVNQATGTVMGATGSASDLQIYANGSVEGANIDTMLAFV